MMGLPMKFVFVNFYNLNRLVERLPQIKFSPELTIMFSAFTRAQYHIMAIGVNANMTCPRERGQCLDHREQFSDIRALMPNCTGLDCTIITNKCPTACILNC